METIKVESETYTKVSKPANCGQDKGEPGEKDIFHPHDKVTEDVWIWSEDVHPEVKGRICDKHGGHLIVTSYCPTVKKASPNVRHTDRNIKFICRHRTEVQ